MNACLKFLKYKLHQKTCILWKFRNSSFYITTSGNYSNSLDHMFLILILLQNELPTDTSCELCLDFKKDLKFINNCPNIVTESTKKQTLEYVLESLNGCIISWTLKCFTKTNYFKW